MSSNPELMSKKEKEYIAFCFNRSFNSLKTDIDYCLILDGKKIYYDLKQDKKEIKTIFGKHFKRSRKHFRTSANTKTPFLNDSLLMSQFFEIFTILKYVELDAQSKTEIENNMISHFEECFSILCDSSKMLEFLGHSLDVLSDDKRAELMRIFFLNCDQIKDADALFAFLDRNIDSIPVDASCITSRLWTCNSGYLLALFLILKDRSYLPVIFDSFMASTLIDCKYLHRLVAIFESLCDSEQCEKLSKRLQSEGICQLNDNKIN